METPSTPDTVSDQYSVELSPAELAKLRDPEFSTVTAGESSFGREFDQRADEIAQQINDEARVGRADDSASWGASDDTESLIDTETEDGGQELQGEVGGQQDGKQGGQQAAEAAQTHAWATQDVLDNAATFYNLSETEVKEFSSLADLEKFQNKLDRRIFDMMRQQSASQEGQQAAQVPQNTQQAAVTAQHTQQPAAPAPVADQPGFKNGKVDLEYFKKNYDADDPILAVVQHAAQMQESLSGVQGEFEKHQQLSQAVIERLAQQEEYNQTAAFNSAVDAYDLDFFGRAFDKSTGQPTALGEQYSKRRGELLEYATGYVIPKLEMMRNAGQLKRVPTMNEIIHQSARALFGSEIDDLRSKRRAASLKAQAAKKRSVGSAVPGLRPGLIRDRDGGGGNELAREVAKLSSNPAVIAAWNQVESARN